MKLFTCQACQQMLFFESTSCVRCGRALLYLPDRALVSAVEPDRGAIAVELRALAPGAEGARYRLCANGREHGVCNWAVPADDPVPFCRACRLNHVIPNLGDPAAKGAWRRLEVEKRRLLYTLDALGLPVEPKGALGRGLSFAFLADGPTAKVYTGHHDGTITINIAEADDAHREKTRVAFGEPYRTLLGHFRHEIGHYYWARLIDGGPLLERFRATFGDERADYAAAQRRHYAEGPPGDWQARFVSAYASMHPWEDFAESWAHYLHITDTLETARAYGLSLKPEPLVAAGPLASAPTLKLRRLDLAAFDELIEGWIPVTIALNALNRSMGLADPYPFVLSPPAIGKLRFVHDLIAGARATGRG